MKRVGLLLFFVMPLGVGAYEGKYEGFELSVKDGVQEYDVRTGKTKLPIDITSLVNQYFGISNEDGWINSSTHAITDEGVVVRGEYSSRKKEIIERISGCDYSGNASSPYIDCGKYMLLVADPSSGNVIRFDTHKMAEFGLYDAFNSEIWKLNYDAYGCHIANPIKIADIDLDGSGEILYVGGFGSVRLDMNEFETTKTFKTTLTIFDPKKKSNRLFTHELSYENFFDRYRSYDKPTEYQVSTPYSLGSDGRVLAPDRFAKDGGVRKPGIRRFSKLFFKDFDKNDKLDILVWQREYISRLKTDSVKGFELNNVVFRLFEESEQGFVEKSISSEIAEQYLAEYGLTWRDGYPNTNLCRHRNSDESIIEDYVINKMFNIYDPVLER